MMEALRRKTYTTPTSFLELMKIFLEVYGKQRDKLSTRLNRYVIGGQKMTEMQPVLVKASADTAELMVQVEKDQIEAGKVAEVCAVEEGAAAKAAGEANEFAADVQRDLDEALPEFYDAMKSLDALDKKDLQEMKGFNKPPELVVTVVSAVCLLMGKKENWDEGLKILSDAKLIDTLKEYDKDALAMNAKLTGKLQKYIKME